jgi:hypothetical protein
VPIPRQHLFFKKAFLFALDSYTGSFIVTFLCTCVL